MTRKAPVPALERLPAFRLVATPAALDAVRGPMKGLVLRTAPDEIIVILDNTDGSGGLGAMSIEDEHAIMAVDSSLMGEWVAAAEALDILQRESDWELPTRRPAFAQGAVAGIPVKLWLEDDRVLFVVAAPFAADFQERCR